MERMNKTIKIGYILSIIFLIIGLRISLTWSYTSRLVGVFLVFLSIIIAYICYKKTHTNYEFFVDKKNAFLGFFLVVIDVFYNIISGDTFKSFDYGVMIAGFVIILLNMGFSHYLKLDKKTVSFTTYFIFITMLMYGFLFSGLSFLLGNKDYNPLFKFTTESVVLTAGYILNFIKPTTINGSLIDFQGFRVSVGNACSGVESISVFFSAAIAYMIAMKVRDIKKMCEFIIIGGFILYLVNIFRVMIIILTGYYLGVEKMLFVHYHLGWIFFLVGMAFFWNYLINNVNKKNLS